MFRRVLEKINPAAFLKEAKASAATISEHEQKLIDICRLSSEEALVRVGSSERGLGEPEIDAARKQYGVNEIGHKKRTGFVVDILHRCKNPLVIQLLLICVVMAYPSENQDIPSAVIVGCMLLLSVVLGYVQEHRSSQAVEKLQSMVQTNCHVVRGGQEVEIPMAEIVPGDIVILQAGAIIPADMRLITAKDFFVSQSSLTGESMPVEKTSVPSGTEIRAVIELPNACFQGSNVLRSAPISDPSRTASRASACRRVSTVGLRPSSG